ncbi:MAG: hypothetical protein HZA16_03380 [Nitrospirae bacterium]|nr:hypothetical protein [Nitrospirota bacterium]
MMMGNSEFSRDRIGPVIRFAMALFLGVCLFMPPSSGLAQTNIINTKHDLSASGPGPIKAFSESRICVFCHTPHNATPSSPLWNKELEPQSYSFYTSPSLKSPVPIQPTGPTKLCLSCHDGTLALGAVVNPAVAVSGGVIAMQGGITTMPAGTLSNLGLNLSVHHPVSFSYYSALPNAELYPTPPPELVFGGLDAEMHCTTCHDPHNDSYGKFLNMNNRYSALCIACHQKSGWTFSAHAASQAAVNGLLPMPPRTWPTWTSVSEWGCESCHLPHFAGGPLRLLNYQEEERNCYLCHDGAVASKNIKAQFQKISRHPVEATMIGMTAQYHDPTEEPAFISDRHVECADCHNPHAANNRSAAAPHISGRLENVSGVDANRAEANPALHEYEVCFKCHADLAPEIFFIPRVVDSTNTRVDFALSNPSYHPVIGMGRNPDVPSIPSTYEPGLSESSIIYCTACHRDDGGVSGGPHGSNYAPILRAQYLTTDNTPESFQNYALCYTCHDRTSILGDQSFNRHLEHIVDRTAPCSVCHDPHGIRDDGVSGSHTNLMNFDTRTVFPAPGNQFPIFTDTGAFSGSCTLVCHGRTHVNESYP